ncbi:MAG: hypothetical protein JXA37_14155 [Chloroflexia bacterium]|nr:hypothetical protein [Chloroflexia bacterium]
MPQIAIPQQELLDWGKLWLGTSNPETKKKKKANSFDRHQSVNFAAVLDREFAKSLSIMLGQIPVRKAKSTSIVPPGSQDCVEFGQVRIIGAVRPQNFDVAYRPDGPRVAFDSKTLNDMASVRKNWQNMINDLSTEATTVHIRFPYAVVAFIVMIPKPALASKQETDIIRTLERLGTRSDVLDQAHLAEVVALVAWDPQTGTIDPSVPPPTSNIRIETFSDTLYQQYVSRYKGLPPHD